MNQEELDLSLRTWKILSGIRKGNNLMTNDPLFAPRPTIIDNRPPKTLHVMVEMFCWWEHEVDFEFTGRIKYETLYGDFNRMLLEVTWDYEHRSIFNFYRKSMEAAFRWVDADAFEYKYHHEEAYEGTIVEC